MTTQRTNTGANLASRPERLAMGRLVGWACPVCSRRINSSGCSKRGLQVDHLHAHALGGSDEPGNLIPLCGQCNAAKRDHELTEGLAYAVRAATRLKTLNGARDRVAHTNLASDLEWLAVAVGAIITEMRS